MDFVLVFPLILAFLSGGLCRTELPEQTSISCYKICPAGYHKTGDCDNGSHKCEKCENDTFTEKENLLKKCLRCNICARANEVKIRQCSSNSDTVCGCKEGYYYYDYGDSGNSFKFCKQCTYQNCKDPNDKHINNREYKRTIQNCQREECLNHAECKKKCTLTSRPPANMTASITVSPKYITVKSTPTIPSNGNPLEAKGANDIPWLYLLMVVSILVILFGLLLFTKYLQRKPNFHPSWSMNKGMESHVQDPKIHEQRSHQMSSPTTLTYTIFEETPMMSVSHSPATPKHPAHISTLLPNAEQKVARQDEQSEHWPAIVLYAIIKEVPLRRWKEFLRLLSVADQQLERVELEAGYSLGSMERQYQMLRLWSQGSTASLNDVFSALHYMDLSGCAQLLQESLEKLQWKSEQK